MHTLEEKKGKDTVTHYFDHVTEPDGAKKHVYLGTELDDVNARLNALRANRINSDNPVITKLDEVKEKLNKVGEYNRSYDDILLDVKKMYFKEKQLAKHLNADVSKRSFPFVAYSVIFLFVVGFGISAYFYGIHNIGSDASAITGAAVTGLEKAANNPFVTTAFGIFIGILLFGLVLHFVHQRHEHRHDDYKPPEAL